MTEDAGTPKFSKLDGDWMPCPKTDLDYPALAYLVPLDNLIVFSKPDRHLEFLGKTGCYTIFNNQGQKVFLAVRETKEGNVKIFNVYGNKVLEVVQPFAYFLHTASVFCPPGKHIGVIREKFRFKPGIHSFLATRTDDDWAVEIKAQGKSLEYDIVFNEESIGVIKESWMEVAVVNVDNFGVKFPVDMDVGKKAILLGACFLIACLKYK